MRYALVDAGDVVTGILQLAKGIQPIVPEGCSVRLSTSAALGQIWNGSTFVTPAETLDQAKAAKTSALYGQCDAVITGGCTSSALGSVHTYPTTLVDQINMMASFDDSMLAHPDGWTTPFYCEDSSGVWDMRNHTAPQIQQAASDIKLFILNARTHLRALNAAIAAATDIPTVQAIVWA